MCSYMYKMTIVPIGCTCSSTSEHTCTAVYKEGFMEKRNILGSIQEFKGCLTPNISVLLKLFQHSGLYALITDISLMWQAECLM